MKILAGLVEQKKNAMNISGPITFSFGQDETPVSKGITVVLCDGQLSLVGFCGFEPHNGETHVCFGAHTFAIESLADIIRAFEVGRVANSISLVMRN